MVRILGLFAWKNKEQQYTFYDLNTKKDWVEMQLPIGNITNI